MDIWADGPDPETAQAIGAKRRRVLSPERLAAAIARLERVRPTQITQNSRSDPCVAGEERG